MEMLRNLAEAFEIPRILARGASGNGGDPTRGLGNAREPCRARGIGNVRNPSRGFGNAKISRRGSVDARRLSCGVWKG